MFSTGSGRSVAQGDGKCRKRCFIGVSRTGISSVFRISILIAVSKLDRS